MKRHESQTHWQMLQPLDEDRGKDMETKIIVRIGNGEITKDLLTSALDAHNTKGKLKMKTSDLGETTINKQLGSRDVARVVGSQVEANPLI